MAPAAGSLWAWASAAYGRAGVAEACLALQDAHAQNTCLLLWAAYARPREAALTRAAAVARAWDIQAVQPLRAVRRALKAAVPEMDDAARLALRADVQAVELAAERRLLDALEEICGEPGEGSALAALKAASAAWGAPAPAAALADLAAALE